MYGINQKGEYLAQNVKDANKIAYVIFGEMLNDEDRLAGNFKQLHNTMDANNLLPSQGNLDEDQHIDVCNEIIENLNLFLAKQSTI